MLITITVRQTKPPERRKIIGSNRNTQNCKITQFLIELSGNQWQFVVSIYLLEASFFNLQIQATLTRILSITGYAIRFIIMRLRLARETLQKDFRNQRTSRRDIKWNSHPQQSQKIQKGNQSTYNSSCTCAQYVYHQTSPLSMQWQGWYHLYHPDGQHTDWAQCPVLP